MRDHPGPTDSPCLLSLVQQYVPFYSGFASVRPATALDSHVCCEFLTMVSMIIVYIDDVGGQKRNAQIIKA